MLAGKSFPPTLVLVWVFLRGSHRRMGWTALVGVFVVLRVRQSPSGSCLAKVKGPTVAHDGARGRLSAGPGMRHARTLSAGLPRAESGEQPKSLRLGQRRCLA